MHIFTDVDVMPKWIVPGAGSPNMDISRLEKILYILSDINVLHFVVMFAFEYIPRISSYELKGAFVPKDKHSLKFLQFFNWVLLPLISVSILPHFEDLKIAFLCCPASCL